MDIEQPSQKNTYGVILAGGSSIRMGQPHKGLMPFDTSTILQRIIQNIQPQVAQLLLNVNADETLYHAYTVSYGLTIIRDGQPFEYLPKQAFVNTSDLTSSQDHLGPLAGICAAMTKIKTLDANAKWLMTVPCDCPYLPTDLLIRLSNQIHTTQSNQTTTRQILVVNPCSNGRKHHVIGVWSLDLEEPLRNFLASGQRAVGKFLQSVNNTFLEFDTGENDPFFNVNTPDDYQTILNRSNKKT